MTGPEHYRRAEELLGGRNNGGANGARSCEEAIALAQVHATLALAAAQIEHAVNADGQGISSDWIMAVSE